MKCRNIVMQRPREPVQIVETNPVDDYIALLARDAANRPKEQTTELASWWPRSRTKLSRMGVSELRALVQRASVVGMEAMARGDRYGVQVCMERMSLCKKYLLKLGAT